MGDGSSQSFFESLIKHLNSSLSENQNSFSTKTSESAESAIDKHFNENSNDLDWHESSIEAQDMVDSINIHKRILDSEIDTIDKELNTILKNRDTVDYLITLLKRREKLESQVHQLEGNLDLYQKEG